MLFGGFSAIASAECGRYAMHIDIAFAPGIATDTPQADAGGRVVVNSPKGALDKKRTNNAKNVWYGYKKMTWKGSEMICYPGTCTFQQMVLPEWFLREVYRNGRLPFIYCSRKFSSASTCSINTLSMPPPEAAAGYGQDCSSQFPSTSKLRYKKAYWAGVSCRHNDAMPSLPDLPCFRHCTSGILTMLPFPGLSPYHSNSHERVFGYAFGKKNGSKNYMGLW
jgi:hypothetical protein